VTAPFDEFYGGRGRIGFDFFELDEVIPVIAEVVSVVHVIESLFKEFIEAGGVFGEDLGGD